MKNVQVIDGAINCTYSIYAFTEEEFLVIFSEPGQNIEFIEDALDRVGSDILDKTLVKVWRRLVAKPDVLGIHGTLFYELENKKKFYKTKSQLDVVGQPSSPSTVR